MEGKILLNGVESSLGKIKNVFGFVPQDDIVLDNLTVRQNLLYSALLRLPEKYSFKTKIKIVDHVLSLLQLEHIADSVVGSVEERGISGGQRKRVNMYVLKRFVLLF
jgi:ABC-type multidrug transport system ATPase subunit